MTKVRWTNTNDHYFGPFTFAKDDYSKYYIGIVSKDDENNPAYFRLSLGKYNFLSKIPNIIKPHVEWIDTTKYEWSTNPKGGYFQIDKREYSIGYMHDVNYVSVRYGIQSNGESEYTGFTLPWKEWTYIERRYYHNNGEYYDKLIDASSLETRTEYHTKQQEILKNLHKGVFVFEDFDGEEIKATTYINEMEWSKGRGWFSFLKYFVPNKISRSLKIEFSSEVGTRKGSWKGGTIGHSIHMNKDETITDAFKRYCKKNQLKYLYEESIV